VALIGTIACAGNSPTSPSLNSNGSGSGAVIAGVVSGTGLQAAANANASSVTRTTSAVRNTSAVSGLTVRIVGTDRSAPVQDTGTFEITDVPTGKVKLQFKGGSVDATIEISNVTEDQFIEIQVQLDTTSAVVLNEERLGKVSLCHAEGNGTYHLISVSENAESDHRAHGDGKVGDPVPGRTLMVFDDTCKPAGPAVDIQKLTNGDDADSAPGPEIEVGKTVTWEYRITNTGTVNLTAIAVVDNQGVVVDCGGKTTLAAGASMICTGSGVATLGQYSNVGTVTASYTTTAGPGTITDSDASHYLGVDPDEETDGEKVTLCHKTGTDKYVKIEVSVEAEPAHRAHGDGEPGKAVPGVTGKTFNASCGVV
jgi:hypothetical protein